MTEKELFYQHFAKYYLRKANKRPWDKKYLNEVAHEIISAKTSTKKTRRQYYLLNTYDVVDIAGENSVIKKVSKQNDSLQYIIAAEEIYDRLLEIHINCGHGSRDKMLNIIHQSSTIPRPCVEMFLRSCKICQTKKNKISSKIVVKPILTKEFMTRGQVDLIDLQSIHDQEFKWILNYQDHATKYICLRPLRSKHAAEVAKELLNIFLQFGAPTILQSDNGREFTSKIIEELKIFWPQLNIVHGRPRHPQSQGSIERSNQDVENMLRAWMTDNNSTNWSQGCYFVQWQKNNSFHRIIGRSPYKAVFGFDAKLGLKSTNLPDYIKSSITTEDDLNAIEKAITHSICEQQIIVDINETESNNELSVEQEIVTNENNVPQSHCDTQYNNNSGNDISITHFQVTESTSINQPIIMPIICVFCEEETQESIFCKMCNTAAHASCLTEDDICKLCLKQQEIRLHQAHCYVGQKRQAEQMISTTKKQLHSLDVGDCVILNVDKVDRSPGDPPNIICVITDYKNNVFQLGTNHGILKAWFNKTDLQKAPTNFVKLSDINSDKFISVREAVSATSLFNGQGYVRCACQPSKRQCQNNRCQCFKQKVQCNSRCHKSITCANK